MTFSPGDYVVITKDAPMSRTGEPRPRRDTEVVDP